MDEKMRGYLRELVAASRAAGSAVLAFNRLAATPEDRERLGGESNDAEEWEDLDEAWSLARSALGLCPDGCADDCVKCPHNEEGEG